MDSMSKLLKLAQKSKHIQESIDIIESAFAKYHLDNLCVSFNGGKDCTAVLHLVHSVSKQWIKNDSPRLNAFYAQLPNHFEQESKFVLETVERYNLNLMQYSANPSLKVSLHALRRDAPYVEAIFIGTRKDDLKPGTQMDAMAPTDAGWPEFMRVNPILNWSYNQVWDFIRDLDLQYCDLYKQGYSSLGTRDNTTKNTNLLRYNELGEIYYVPAWSLTSPHEERLSRNSSMDVDTPAAKQ